jgi:hypothetical protein
MAAEERRRKALLERDRVIYLLRQAGQPYRAIADAHGLSDQRAREVVAFYQSRIDRALMVRWPWRTPASVGQYAEGMWHHFGPHGYLGSTHGYLGSSFQLPQGSSGW